MNAGVIDKAIDAFINGDTDFGRLRRSLELHVGRNPARQGPARARLDSLLEAGRMSAALHQILVEELERAASAEVTIAADADEDAAGDATGGPVPPDEARGYDPDEFLEPTIPDDRPGRPPAEPAAGPQPPAAPASEPEPEPLPESSAPEPEPEPASSAAEAGSAADEDAGGGPPADQGPDGDQALSGAGPGPETREIDKEREESPGPAVAAAPGHVLAGRYVLESVLGRGGMSAVFRGRDLRMPQGEDAAQAVAVKLLTPEFARRADARAALAREASLSRQLHHPAFVRVFDCDASGPVPFLVMELLQGERLKSLLVRRYPSPLPLEEAMTVIRGLADALAYLHRSGLVHGDVKPGNVFLSPGGRVRLLDLGVTGGEGETAAAAMRARTPAYASPAMLTGQPPSPADDVYALGCVAYEVLAGHHPFGKLPGDEAAAKGAGPERIDSLSPGRWQALRRSLQFDAGQRQPDAGAFLAEFFPPAAAPRPARPWAAGGILAGLLLGLALGWFLPRPEGVVSGAKAVFERGSALVKDLLPAPDSDADRAGDRVVQGPGPAGDASAGDGERPAGGDSGAGEETTASAGPGAGDRIVPGVASAGADLPAPAEAEDVAEPGLSAAGSDDAGESQAETPPVAASAAAQEPAATPTGVTPVLRLPAEILRVSEGSSALKLSVLRPEGYEGPLRLEWRTQPGTAEDGSDYAGGDWQELEAPAGAAALVLYIPIVNDGREEPPESFFVEVRSAPGAGPRIAGPDRAQIIVLDDD